MKEREEPERRVLHQVIRRVHDGSLRISDSAQSELQSGVRRRIIELEELGGGELSKEARDALARDIATKIREHAPSSVNHKVVVRRSLLERIIDWLDSQF